MDNKKKKKKKVGMDIDKNYATKDRYGNVTAMNQHGLTATGKKRGEKPT